MFFHLQYIHLFRPFLKYAPSASPLPPHVSPRRICTANAGAISKLMRLYKKLYNLRQICNIAVYMIHSACTIHLLNLPEKTARRDVIHGIKALEEIAEDWLCARRTLSIISVLARKWNVEMPEEAAHVLQRTDERWGTFSTSEVPSPRSHLAISPSPPPMGALSPSTKQEQYSPAAASNQPANVTNNRQPPTASMSPDILDGLAAPRTDFADIQNIQRLNNGSNLDLNMNGMGGQAWRPAPVTQAIPAYSRSYAPVSNNASSGRTTQSGTRNVTPSSAYAVDGQDWYLKDGVNWQSGFDAWNLGNAASSGNNGLADSSMFMFTGNTGSPSSRRSPPSANFDFESLNNLSGSMDGWDPLAGLD